MLIIGITFLKYYMKKIFKNVVMANIEGFPSIEI